MGNIHVLPFAVANLIAAGEVVDRPASVIKELMENSIDAGANRITVEIQRGGVTFMRVSDNGCGMSREDLPVAIQRHATSKIRQAEDLDGILTLGFRGEALAAIASVSDIRILTKTEDAPYASMLEAHCGEVVGITEQGGSVGTSIIVENLFANVPARRKFLKKDMTEAMAVTTNVEKVALSHPEIAVRLIIDGTVKLDTAGNGDLKSTVYAIYGKEFSARMLNLQFEQDGIAVRGLIGRTDCFKANRNYENFFINGRFVKSRTAMAAIEQAYTSYMPPEKFPCCVLFIEINPARVDVNVHPAKLEVKFSNEKPVFEAIYYSVRTVLESNSQRPSMELSFASRKQRNAFADRELMSRTTTPVIDRRDGSAKPEQLSCALFASLQQEPLRMTAQEYRERYGNDPKAAEKDSVSASVQKQTAFSEESNTKAKIDLSAVASVSQPQNEDIDVVRNRSERDGEEEHRAARLLPSNGTDSSVPTRSFSMPVITDPMPTLTPPEPKLIWDTETDPGSSVRKAIPQTAGKQQSVSASNSESSGSPADSEQASETTSVQPEKDLPFYRIVGEVFHTYVIVECEQKMLLVDKHAAHERILFEQLKARLKSVEPCAQMLMLPIEVMMTAGEIEALREYRNELEQIGFSLRYAKHTVYADAIPEGIQADGVADMLQAMADRILTATGSVRLTRDILFEKALYQAACKAAVKAGRDYADGHIDWIVRKLMELPDITFCPHGRPVALELTQRALDRQFDRTGF